MICSISISHNYETKSAWILTHHYHVPNPSLIVSKFPMLFIQILGTVYISIGKYLKSQVVKYEPFPLNLEQSNFSFFRCLFLLEHCDRSHDLQFVRNGPKRVVGPIPLAEVLKPQWFLPFRIALSFYFLLDNYIY